MARACRHMYAQGKSLIWKFHMCTERVKLKSFTTYCSQFFCGHLLYLNNSDMFYKIIVAYNSVFKSFLRLPTDAQGRPCSAFGMSVSEKLNPYKKL